jgi:hypothetical protein
VWAVELSEHAERNKKNISDEATSKSEENSSPNSMPAGIPEVINENNAVIGTGEVSCLH